MTTNMTPNAACPRCGGWSSYGGMSQHSKSPLPVMGRTGCLCGGPKTYVFHWDVGGYNTVQASNRQEAVRKAVSLGVNMRASGVRLSANPVTVHLAKPGEVAALDCSWASMFN